MVELTTINTYLQRDGGQLVGGAEAWRTYLNRGRVKAWALVLDMVTLVQQASPEQLSTEYAISRLRRGS